MFKLLSVTDLILYSLKDVVMMAQAIEKLFEQKLSAMPQEVGHHIIIVMCIFCILCLLLLNAGIWTDSRAEGTKG